jgi:glycosyltransferase involved in cell wall biosynthesis
VQTSLSVVIPAFNSSGWITKCLSHLEGALSNAGISDTQVIVVDDGSTDGTAQEAENFTGLNVSVIRQPNQGRFMARKVGLQHCYSSHVLFLDTRVFLDESSLKFVLPFLTAESTSLWTAHVNANTERNPIARFWRAIETIFWRRYMVSPSTTSFGLEDFDYFPKGTTALIAPVRLISDAINDFEPTVTDWRKVNDDTALLRYAAERTRINISPQYSCTYNARTSFKAFLKHANHRGSVLIDGYLRRGTRLNIPIWLVLILFPFALVFAIVNWKLGLAGSLMAPALLYFVTRTLGVTNKDSLVLSALSWPFAIYYLAGMYWGLWLKLKGVSSVQNA